MEPEEEPEEEEEDMVPEDEPPPIGFWDPIPPPEEDLDPPELPPPPEPIGDLALEEGGVPGTPDCCIFMGEDSFSPELPERECEGEMLGFMLGFISEPGGLPPRGFILLLPPIPPPPPPGPVNPCLVMGEDPGFTPIP